MFTVGNSTAGVVEVLDTNMTVLVCSFCLLTAGMVKNLTHQSLFWQSQPLYSACYSHYFIMALFTELFGVIALRVTKNVMRLKDVHKHLQILF